MAVFDLTAGRFATLAYVAQHPGCLRREICAELGLNQVVVCRYLRLLIDLGAIYTDPPPPATIVGKTVRYWANADLLRREVAAIADALHLSDP